MPAWSLLKKKKKGICPLRSIFGSRGDPFSRRRLAQTCRAGLRPDPGGVMAVVVRDSTPGSAFYLPRIGTC